ncbi:Tautomerase/MIF superfamily [Trichoderma barbatum]
MDQPATPRADKPPILSIAKANPDAAATTPSPISERKFKPKSKMSSLETVPESDSRTQSQHASSSVDALKLTTSASHSDKERLAAKRSQYFHDALHERSGTNSAAAAVRAEALIYAEVKTNVKIESEDHFLTTFSHQLAARYNRYPSSTVVSLHHSQCLFFGGSPNPAYTLTITALASEVQPATNKRNASVLQKHMEAMLRIPPARGMVRFVSVAEECLAWGSKTVAGRISEAVADDGDGEGERNKAQERRRLKALSLKRPSPTNITSSNTQHPAPSQQAIYSTDALKTRVESSDVFGANQGVKVVRKKKSIIHTLFRTSKVEDEDPSES